MQQTIKRRQVLAMGLALPALASPAVSTAAAAFPSKTIKFILPFSAGGGTDETARVLAEEVSKLLKVPVICENKPGASGAIAVRAITTAPADGHSVLIATNSLVAVNPVAVKNLGYDPFKDLTPVHGIRVSPPIVSAPLNSPYASVKEALLRAKASGQPLKIGNYSHGYELLAAWIGQLEKVAVVHVPYKGPSPMLVDLIGGQLDFAISDPSSAFELMQGGRIKAAAICGGQRDATLPKVPTLKEQGYPDFESYTWSSVYAKAGTPADVLKRLSDAVAQANRTPAMVARRTGFPGKELDLALADMGKFQRQEFERFQRVAKATNYQPK